MSNQHDQFRRRALRRAAFFLSMCTGIMLVALVLSLFIFDESGLIPPLAVVVLLNVGLIYFYLKLAKDSEHSAHLRQTR